MSNVLVLMSDPARPALDTALAAAIRAAVDGAPERWLMPGVACEIALPETAGEPRAATAAARAALAAAPVDAAVVETGGRRKRLLLADMDSTIIGQECIDELADMVGLKAHVAEITERAMRGEIDFEPALRERVALLKDLAADVIERVLAERITLTPGAATLVATMRAHGARTALVSGGFTAFTRAVAARAGFDETRANELLVADGRLTGLVAEPILGREGKLDTLRELRARLGLAPGETMAVGDGANDLAMLGEAGLGVAYRAKPAVAEMTDVRIEHADLTALLFLQGYAAADFAAA